jgi:murein DD-endopeptidase MepM/ murein hydrolase activator NlpD
VVALGASVLGLLTGCAGERTALPGPQSGDPRDPVQAGGQTETAAVRDLAASPGITHVLQKGQTLSALSRAYGVPVGTLLEVNGITDPTRIPAGTPIKVPGARQLVIIPEEDALFFSWPLRGRLTTAYSSGDRGRRHEGVDIDGNLGEPVLAAADGVVARMEADGAYGRTLLLDHGGGWTTLYAHLNRRIVRPGDRVARGQQIGEVGRTGNARGTHLHFEIRRDGRPVNPLGPLRAGAVSTAAPR